MYLFYFHSNHLNDLTIWSYICKDLASQIPCFSKNGITHVAAVPRLSSKHLWPSSAISPQIFIFHRLIRICIRVLVSNGAPTWFFLIIVIVTFFFKHATIVREVFIFTIHKCSHDFSCSNYHQNSCLDYCEHF